MDTSNSLSYYFIDDICVSPDSMYCDQLLNIKEIANSNLIQLFPNPARDWITVRGNGIKSLKIYDVSGKLYYLSTLSIDSYKINVSTFASGIYIIKIETKKGAHYEKLILNN